MNLQNITQNFMHSHYYISIFLRLTLAMGMGAVIGYERAIKKSTAGLRTFSIVCTASAFTMIINEYLIEQYGTGDAARLAAQVISGIGFLGMGSIILTSRNQVRGLTTAATLWATAILGVAIGAGMLFPSLIAFLIMLFTTTILYYISQRLEHYNRYITIYLEIDRSAGLRQIIDALTEQGFEVMQLQKHKSSPEGDLTLQLDLNLKGKYLHSDIIYHLGQMESIHYIEEVRKK
jgi:Uncharacterized membrane protein